MIEIVKDIVLFTKVVNNDVTLGVKVLNSDVVIEGVPVPSGVVSLIPNSLRVNTTIVSPLLSTTYQLIPNSLLVDTSINTPEIGVIYAFTPNSLNVGTSISTATLSTTYALISDSLNVDVTINEPELVDVVAGDLLAHYPLGVDSDEVVGTTLGINGADTSISYDGTSADFTSASKIIIPDNDIFSITDGLGNDIPYTIEFEMMIDSLTPSTSNYFVAKSVDNSNREYLCSLSTTLHLRMWLWNADNSGRILTDADATGVIIAANTFYKIKYTYDGSKLWTGIKIYVDDVELATTNLNSGTYVGQTNTSSDVSLGQMQSYATPKFNGRMKNVKFLNYVA